MRVVATKDGFYNGKRVPKGKEFDFLGKRLGSWMKPVDQKTGKEPKAKEPKQKNDESSPSTLSEITKINQKEEKDMIDQKTGKEA